MNYTETIKYIHSVSWLGSRPGLTRIKELCDGLSNPEDSLKFIHVTGTNGKGSTCAMTDSILRSAGYKTGLFTSPYVKKFNERIQINGEPVSNELLAEATEKVKSVADKMKEPPTEFELITAISLVVFSIQKCDVVIFEVGMGGRLDSTNIIKSSLVSVITGVSLDHTAYLGDTVAEIAKEKAGIIKNGCPVLYGGKDYQTQCTNPDLNKPKLDFLDTNGQSEHVFNTLDTNGSPDPVFNTHDNKNYNEASLPSESPFSVIKSKAEEKGSELYFCDYGKLQIKKADLYGSVFDYKEYKDIKINLLGLYQPENAIKAIEIINVLNKNGFSVSKKAIFEGLEKTKWAARFEKLSDHPLVIYDGSHNPEGIQAATKTLYYYFKNQKLNLLTGVMADKDYSDMAKSLSPFAKKVFTVTPENPRSLPSVKLKHTYESFGVTAEAFDSVFEGFKAACLDSEKTGTPLICLGSLYMYCEVADAAEKILKNENG